jgi:hypothetical protein
MIVRQRGSACSEDWKKGLVRRLVIAVIEFQQQFLNDHNVRSLQTPKS